MPDYLYLNYGMITIKRSNELLNILTIVIGTTISNVNIYTLTVPTLIDFLFLLSRFHILKILLFCQYTTFFIAIDNNIAK